MSGKKFFEALMAGAKLAMVAMWPVVQFFIVVLINGFIIAMIIRSIPSDGSVISEVTGVIFVVVVPLMSAMWEIQIYNHCKEAVHYAEQNDVDMVTAWKKTTKLELY